MNKFVIGMRDKQDESFVIYTNKGEEYLKEVIDCGVYFINAHHVVQSSVIAQVDKAFDDAWERLEKELKNLKIID